MVLKREIREQKAEIIRYFRNRASEFLSEIRLEYGDSQFKEQAGVMNKKLTTARENLVATLLQQCSNENWTSEERLEAILTVTYSNYVVMLESRNEIWEYDYMTFSRRIGEIWEPFCKLCFQYSLRAMQLFIPPLFADVKLKLTKEIEDYVSLLPISTGQKTDLLKYYRKVWSLVVSGDIQLELDLHFIQNDIKYVVDFKSGFGSNEKGNTNRLLLVATIYKNLEENYQCLIFVRSKENNHYFKTLKNSNVWEAYCGEESYEKIAEHSGFNLKKWIESNVHWLEDLSEQVILSFTKNNLSQYLKW